MRTGLLSITLYIYEVKRTLGKFFIMEICWNINRMVGNSSSIIIGFKTKQKRFLSLIYMDTNLTYYTYIKLRVISNFSMIFFLRKYYWNNLEF